MLEGPTVSEGLFVGRVFSALCCLHTAPECGLPREGGGRGLPLRAGRRARVALLVGPVLSTATQPPSQLVGVRSPHHRGWEPRPHPVSCAPLGFQILLREAWGSVARPETAQLTFLGFCSFNLRVGFGHT